MQTLTLRGNLSQEIFNATQKFVNVLSRPQQFNTREILNGLLLSSSSHLNHLGRANGATATERKTIERFSNALEKLPLKVMEQIHVQSLAYEFKDEPVLLLSDGGDFQKPHARKMEGVCSAVDGSEGHSVGWGYPAYSLMAFGLETEKLRPLTLHVYSTGEEGFKGVWDEQKKAMDPLNCLINSSLRDRIMVEDRGCDDEKRFIYFLENGLSFVTRIHAGVKSRTVLIEKDDGEYDKISIKDLGGKLRGAAGLSRRWYNKKLHKWLTSKITYQKVFLEGHLDIPLYVVFCFTDGFDEPLAIITDLKTDDAETAWKHFFYYKKRWEVENFYRAIKQQFGAEKFLLLKLSKIKALLFLIMFAHCLLMKIKDKIKEVFGLVYMVFQDFCRDTQRSGNHHLDILAFIRLFLSPRLHTRAYQFYAVHLRKWLIHKPLNQLSLFDNRKKW